MTALRPVDQEFVDELRARGTAPTGSSVTSVELCAAAGITFRQCDWWTRTGRLQSFMTSKGEVVDPATFERTRHVYSETNGSGFRRRYPAAEVKVAALMRRLLAAGFTVQHAHDAARGYVDDPDELIILGPGLALIVEDES